MSRDSSSPACGGQADQMAYVSELAGGLAHEIRTPLSTFNLNLQLLAEDWGEASTPEERRALKKIEVLQKEAKRLQDILDDFLRFARAQKLELAERDVNELLDQVLTFIGPQARLAKIQIRTSYGSIPRCKVDGDLLNQAFLNIFVNAQQAMPNGGELIVRSRPVPGGIQIDVTDTGEGMNEEELGKVFKAFYSRKKNGTGLGLPTAKRIVEQHGGRITVHSEPKKGTCFTIEIPLSPPGGRGADSEPT